MAIRESLLDALSSIATSDFVRSVTAAGASSKVTVSNLAKTIVENYTGSTLASSSQSVKSAIDALNSKTTGSGTAESDYVSVSYVFAKRGNICSLYVEVTPKQTIVTSTGTVVLSSIPKPATSQSYSATYDLNAAATICGPAELTSAKILFLYGARTSGHVYKASFTYVIE